MGFKGLWSGTWADWFGTLATVIAFSTFLAVLVRTLLRPRAEIEADARLWNDED